MEAGRSERLKLDQFKNSDQMFSHTYNFQFLQELYGEKQQAHLLSEADKSQGGQNIGIDKCRGA